MIAVLVDDLLRWQARGLQPSGIERVVSELLRTARLQPDLELIACESVLDANDPDRIRLVEVSWERLSWSRVPAAGPRSIARRARFGPAIVDVARRVRMPAPLRTIAKAIFHKLRSRRVSAPALGRVIEPELLIVAGVFWSGDAAQRVRAIAESGTPVHVVVYDVFPILNPEWFDPHVASDFVTAFDRVIPIANRIVTLSSATAEALRARYPDVESRVRVAVPTLRAHAPSAAEGTEPIAVEAPFLLALGTVEPRKNHRGLLKAWTLARQDPTIEGAWLVIAGRRGWQSDDLEDEIAALAAREHVRRVDYATDAQIETLYERCSGLVMASWAEGFGLPAREAIARGIPTAISTGVPQDGLSAEQFELFATNDTDHLAELMRGLLSTDAGRRKPVEFGPGTGWEPILEALVS